MHFLKFIIFHVNDDCSGTKVTSVGGGVHHTNVVLDSCKTVFTFDSINHGPSLIWLVCKNGILVGGLFEGGLFKGGGLF